ncbi:GNAT family N-acetyltransferase [Nocardiopsis sp. B62]|uniref:GNAT family N-acetyltransferase n=2 Tax=unclassified Nocardiopsis TaxID=2649073 RepID=UPI001B36F07D|nr:GNAT family N-acetyltransferase [Nocardiopsis sp. B62]MBQ1083281.1 GNAT family N-acetyltransferase [Nocardiopsis sp. B62]
MNDTPPAPRLAKITPENVGAACDLRVHPDQERFVAPVERSLAEAYAAPPNVAWPRLVLAGGEVVGFVMGGFDPDAGIDAFRCGIWRLNVSAAHQGLGYGRFAVEAVAREARRRGRDRLTVLWVPGEGGPEGFYRGVGFSPTGEVLGDQVLGERFLNRDAVPGSSGAV